MRLTQRGIPQNSPLMTTQEESENNNIKVISGIRTVYQGKVGKRGRNGREIAKMR